MPVKNIYVSGNRFVDDNEIRELSGLDEYPSFFLTRSSDIKKKLESHQYINSVRIKKKFGNIIYIYVREFQVIAMSNEHKLILSNGMIIDNVYDLSDVPVLINEVSDKDVYSHFCSKFEKIDTDIWRQISEIEYSPVDVDDERFLLYMSDGNLVYVTLTKITKLNLYNSIMDKLVDKRGTIYLDAGDYVELKNQEFLPIFLIIG